MIYFNYFVKSLPGALGYVIILTLWLSWALRRRTNLTFPFLGLWWLDKRKCPYLDIYNYVKKKIIVSPKNGSNITWLGQTIPIDVIIKKNMTSITGIRSVKRWIIFPFFLKHYKLLLILNLLLIIQIQLNLPKFYVCKHSSRLLS